MDLATFRALRSPAGAALLNRITATGPIDDAAALTLGSKLRREHPVDLVAAAITQARLRQRGAIKFGAAAAQMWFTPDGLQQATHPDVAAHRADRLVRRLGAGAAFLDLCCGIGSDLLAASAAGLRATGVELDPLTAAVAAANLGERAVVHTADALNHPLGDAAVFVDPARRDGRGRVFDPAAYTPPWSFVVALLGAERPAAAKVAPGIPHGLVPADIEAEWVSWHGEVKEAALYSPALSDGTRRRATLLPGGHTLHRPDAEAPAPVGPLGRWLHEPDGAVIRAHLIDVLAARIDARLLDASIAYLTTDHPVDTPFARSYEVLEALPFDTRRLRALLRERGVGRLTVKKRGADIDPERLRRELLRGHRGDAEATLVITRVAAVHTALLVTPRRENSQ
jgi:SAM-dependent methyltransferase